MPWKTTSHDYLKSPIEHALTTDVAILFDNYERVMTQYNKNPNYIATKKGLTFTSYSPKNSTTDSLSKIEHKDEVLEVAWLPKGEMCWTKKEGEIEVRTGLPSVLIEQDSRCKNSGPYTSPHMLIWDVFFGLVNGDDVVLLLDGNQKWRMSVSPLMPLIYAGFDAASDHYDLEDLGSEDLLTLGWANLLMLVSEANDFDLAKYLTKQMRYTADAIAKALLKKTKEDALNPYSDYDEGYFI